MHGYSDRINHALAFAAKHHDQQVRRGARPPYYTQPANLAVILTRYGCEEDTVVAGILLDVVEDYGREAYPAEIRQHRIGEKFGSMVLDIAMAASERRVNDEGIELTPEERRDDLLKRLATGLPQGQMLVAADALHTAGTLLADLRRTVDVPSVWARVPGGRGKTLDWYQRLCDRVSGTSPAPAIVNELRETVSALWAVR